MKTAILIIKNFLLLVFLVEGSAVNGQDIREAPAPLFRDPIHDGAADPVVFWNSNEQEWWMFYTARRANADAADVAYCFGTNIGIASSEDNGYTWVYRGELDLDIEKGKNTFWAPDVVFADGKYHLFVTYKKGVRNHWGGKAGIAHYTSENVWDWKFVGLLSLSSDDVIDATVFQAPDGTWKMWYKDNNQSWLAESDDLYLWTWRNNPVIADKPHEEPVVFELEGYFWLITDEWAGMGVYRSDDLENWEKQPYPILDKPSSRPEDTPSGAHGDVVVTNGSAYIFYFTHPGRKSHSLAPLDDDGVLPYSLRRSSIQVAQIKVSDGWLICDRDKSFNFFLKPPTIKN